MRKLATFAAAFSVAVYIAHYLVPERLFLPLCGACAVFCLASLLFKGEARLRVFLITLAFCAGFGVSALSYQTKTLPSALLDGKQLTVEAKVTEYPTQYDDYSVVEVRLGGDIVPHVQALLCSGEFDISGLTPGDTVRFDAALKSSNVRYGRAWDGYTSDGVYLICYAKSEIAVTGRSATAFVYYPLTVAKNINEAAGELFSEKAAPFMKALLTGYKKDLSEDTEQYADLAVAGILHVVAVSGMHISYLLGFLMLILRKRRRVSLVGLPLIWLFTLMTGAAPSMLRAAIMQTMVLSAPLLRRENDDLTAISAALGILLLINPDACASVSLQLSFAAMLGIILFTPKINAYLTNRLLPWVTANRKQKGLHNIARGAVFAVISALSASVGALVISTPIMALQFGYVSLYSVLVNVLIFWAVSAAFILGGISVALGAIWAPLAVVTAAAANILTAFITGAARAASSLPYAAAYAGYKLFAWWIVFVYAVFGAYCLIARRRRKSLVIPTATAICALCAVVVFTELNRSVSAPKMTALDVGQGECIIFTDGDDTFVVDCGGKGTFKNAGQTAASKLLSEGRRRIDVLALTHFDEDHVNGVIDLMCRVKVDALVIPDEKSDTREEIVEFAEEHGTTVYIIQEDTKLTADGLSLTAFAPVSMTDPELIFLAKSGDCDILITGDAYEEAEKRFLLRYSLPDTDIYVAGHHGSKHASCAELLTAARAETAIISSGYNSYGHPAQETLERFRSAGMRILRTDTLGSITIELEE